ncbi:SGNH/GDSL hydrolase family protein [Haloactinopolyspora alba]|nr:SGNH/GDSL hydrolase family protein [Haloactinopolyspora alba]
MPTPDQARNHPTAVFYGDSIVTGWRGTTAPRARWPSIMSDTLGWREVALAINGMGYYRRRGPRDGRGELSPSSTDTTLLDAAIRLTPDVVVVCLAANDLQFMDEHGEDIYASIRRDLTRLREELHGAHVVVTAYFPTSDLSPRAARIHEWITTTSSDLGLTYVEQFRLAVNGSPQLLCDDGVHPNDAGHAALADAILPVLRNLRI